MTDRVERYRQFAERFHAGKRRRPATEEQIAEAEAAPGVLWPESYRQFALTSGAVSGSCCGGCGGFTCEEVG